MGSPRLAGVGALSAWARTAIDRHAWCLVLQGAVLLRSACALRPEKNALGIRITRGTEAPRMSALDPEVEAANAVMVIKLAAGHRRQTIKHDDRNYNVQCL